MGENFHDFSAEEIRGMMKSQEAKQLVDMLKQLDGNMLSKAAALASSGQTDQAKELLQPFLSDPKVNDILGRMGNHNG